LGSLATINCNRHFLHNIKSKWCYWQWLQTTTN